MTTFSFILFYKAHLSLMATQLAETPIASLEQRRQSWINAYHTGDVGLIDTIETNEFVAITPGNKINQKDDWHINVIFSDKALNWYQNKLGKAEVKYDYHTDNECMITTCIKSSHKSTVIREMWLKFDEIWKLSYLSMKRT